MQKHIFFWSGFFIAAVVGFQIAIWSWGASEQSLRSLGTAIFVASSIMTTLLVVLLFFRKRILKGVFRRTEGSLSEILLKLNKLLIHLSKGESEEAINSSREVSAEIIHYYAFTNFYRWIVTSCLILLGSFAGIAGTILLFEQNQKIEAQTKIMSQQHENMTAQAEIMALPLITQMRNRLDTPVLASAFSTRIETLLIDNCAIEFVDNLRKNTGSNRSQINSIKNLMENRVIGERVIDALEVLMSDDESHVAFSSTQILDQLDKNNDKERYIKLDNMFIKDVKLNGRYRISANNTMFFRFHCAQCQLELVNSVFSDSYVEYIRLTHESIISRISEGFSNSEVVDPVEVDPEEIIKINEMSNTMIIGEKFEYLDQEDSVADFIFEDALDTYELPIVGKMYAYLEGNEKNVCDVINGPYRRNKFFTSVGATN